VVLSAADAHSSGHALAGSAKAEIDDVKALMEGGMSAREAKEAVTRMAVERYFEAGAPMPAAAAQPERGLVTYEDI
jgi:hypothetical protein